jgi:amino acid transporter
MWVARVLSVAANANLLTTYLAALIFRDGSNPEAFRITAITVMAVFFTYVNIVGVKSGMSAILAITVVKFIPLLVLCLVGLTFVTPDAFAGMATPSYEDFGTAMLLVFYAFVGFENALVPAGEFKNPKRDIPVAMFATAAFASILYAVIQTVSYAAKPDLGSSEQPLAAAAEVMMGSFGLWMVSIGAIISVLGNYAAAVLSGPRITYALARDGMLPRILGLTHAIHQTPTASIVLYCGTGLALGIYGSFKELAVMSSLGRLVIYVLVLAAIPRIKSRHKNEKDALRLWGGLTIPVIAFAISLWLVSQARLEAVYKTAALVAVGTVLFSLRRIRRTK